MIEIDGFWGYGFCHGWLAGFLERCAGLGERLAVSEGRSPIAGTAVALFGRQRRACVRFAMMGALSYGVFLWLLYALLTAD